jgi:hypothetical protein
MKLDYRLATISYCPDLTDPSAVSIPIAVLAVGKDDGHWSAAAVGLDAKRLGLDPLSSAMLADVPHMIRRHVDAAMKRLDTSASTAAVLGAFRESLKTSIHVSEIGDSGEVEVLDPRRIAVALFEKSVAVLERALAQLGEQLVAHLGPSSWAPQVAPELLMEPAPEQLFWQPAPPPLSLAAVAH